MTRHGLIESSQDPGDTRKYYFLTAEGEIRLKQDLKRQQHAVKVGEAAGLLNDTFPPELQRLLANL